MNHDGVKTLGTLADCLADETYGMKTIEKSQPKRMATKRTKSNACTPFNQGKYHPLQMSLLDEGSEALS